MHVQCVYIHFTCTKQMVELLVVFQQDSLHVSTKCTHSYITGDHYSCFALSHVQLGWRPLMESYMNTLPDAISDENRKLIRDLFDWLVQPCLDFIQHDCRRFVVTSSLHLVFSLMRLYSCLMDEIRESGQEEGGAKMQQTQVGMMDGLYGLYLVYII